MQAESIKVQFPTMSASTAIWSIPAPSLTAPFLSAALYQKI